MIDYLVIFRFPIQSQNCNILKINVRYMLAKICSIFSYFQIFQHLWHHIDISRSFRVTSLLLLVFRSLSLSSAERSLISERKASARKQIRNRVQPQHPIKPFELVGPRRAREFSPPSISIPHRSRFIPISKVRTSTRRCNRKVVLSVCVFVYTRVAHYANCRLIGSKQCCCSVRWEGHCIGRLCKHTQTHSDDRCVHNSRARVCTDLLRDFFACITDARLFISVCACSVRVAQ